MLLYIAILLMSFVADIHAVDALQIEPLSFVGYIPLP
jgi:hypothetical protein